MRIKDQKAGEFIKLKSEQNDLFIFLNRSLKMIEMKIAIILTALSVSFFFLRKNIFVIV